MSVDHIEVLVEEPSAEAALEILLPKILGKTSFNIHSHQGKPDLLSKLPGKLRAYAAWIPATFRILIVVDRDDDVTVQVGATSCRVTVDNDRPNGNPISADRT